MLSCAGKAHKTAVALAATGVADPMRNVLSVERIVGVLEVLADARKDLGVTEIATAAGIHKATASRLLGALAASSLVERDPETRKYRIGVGLVRLAGSATARLAVIQHARPVLEDLAERTGETVNLGILDRESVVYVDQVTGGSTVLMANWIGRRSPLHCSSSGKVLLGFGDEALREAILRGPLGRLTKNTITDPVRLRAEVEKVRRQGYASSVGELEQGLNTVAAPVWLDERVIAAVSVSGPASRLAAREQPRLARLALDAGTAISRRMGHRGRVRPAGW